MTLRELRQALERDVVDGSIALLGATVIHGGLRARIVETEAYRWDDPACHAYGKQRMKNMALWGDPGSAYVYLSYGCHWMLNVVALGANEPAAVLIRAAEPLSGIDEMQRLRGTREVRNLLSGPGKLAQAMQIGPKENEVDLLAESGSGLRIEPATDPVSCVMAGPRIGIAVGKGHEVPWRFVDGERLQWVSRPQRGLTPVNIEGM